MLAVRKNSFVDLRADGFMRGSFGCSTHKWPKSASALMMTAAASSARQEAKGIRRQEADAAPGKQWTRRRPGVDGRKLGSATVIGEHASGTVENAGWGPDGRSR